VDQGGAVPIFSTGSEKDGDHLRVTVSGEVDMATAESMLQAALEGDPDRLTLDLRAVTFFDSAAIHAVVQLAERFPGTLVVVPSRQVRRVLEISGLADQGWLRADPR
jgi:stage II sporulation protein AA (anti-sigma F factor antagonist)